MSRGAVGGTFGMVGAQSAPSLTPFTVSGRDIIDPDGQVFYPVGANAGLKIESWRYVFEHHDNLGTITSYEHDPITFPNHIAEAFDWNWNIIRVNTIIYNEDPASPNYQDPALLADLLEHGINELLDAGLVVMVTSHDFTGTPGNQVILGGVRDQALKEFLSAAIAKWKDNPYFWINPYNEPYDDEDPTSIANWITLHTEMVEFLRDEGYTGPIVCDLPRWAQGIKSLGEGSLDSFAAIDPNIIFSWHNYGVADGTSLPSNTIYRHEYLAQQAYSKGYCMMVGEFGVANPPESGDGPTEYNAVGATWVLNRARDLKIGAIWWHAYHDEYQLLSNGRPYWESTDGTGLTEYGDLFWKFCHNQIVQPSSDSPIYISGRGADWSGSPRVVNMPLNTLATDTVIALVKHNPGEPTPPGWTQIHTSSSGNKNLYIWTRTGLTESDTITFTSGSTYTLATVRNVGSISINQSYAENGASGNNIGWAGTGILSDNTLLLAIPWSEWRTAQSADTMTSATFNVPGVSLFYNEYDAGSTGPVVFTLNTSGLSVPVVELHVSA